MALSKPCITCGTPAPGSYCDEHIVPRHRPLTDAKREHRRKYYSGSWRALSERARRLSPQCEICGSTQDLTTEHTPEALARIAAGQPLTLHFVKVLCRSHNSQRRWQRGLDDNA